MAATLTITLLSETQEGTIGNDWKYALGAKIFSSGKVGEGKVAVPKHNLNTGQTQEPPGPPKPLVLNAGEPGGEISVDLRLKVEEVDLFKNDRGEIVTSFKLKTPAAGGPPHVEERELTVGVTEEPSGIGTAVFKLTIRMELAS